MAKTNIQNITSTQTFQNWFDKTNEMVDLFREQTVTATALGDVTTGDAFIQGDFQANTLIADTELKMDDVSAFTSSATIQFASPIQITGATAQEVATFSYTQGGAQTRYTDSIISWDVGFNNSDEAAFIIDTGVGEPKFKLTPAGTIYGYDAIFTGSIGADTITANTVTTDDMTANNIVSNTLTSDTFVGKLIGDVYAPGGTTKVFENGNGAEIPATFTGNVNGTVSSLTNHTTDDLGEGDDNLYFTTSRARGSFSSGTGVGIIEGVISIGQNVDTVSTVEFGGVNVDGAIVATGNITAFGSISDRNKKENIVPITNALDKVSKLGGYDFNYIGDDTPMTGVMAQELQEVLPGAVYTTTDPKTGEETLAVRHGNVIGLLIEAIKELQEKVGK
jgi:hypothetical protein